MKRTIFLLCFLAFPTVQAQPSFTINNLFKYAEGEKYFHREDVLDLNVFYKDWSLHTQFEAGNPPEFGKTTYGAHTLRLEYMSDRFSAEVGDIYPLWNHGLSLNLRYERELGYDSGIRGIYLTGYLPKDITVYGVAGQGRFRFSSPLNNDIRTHDWEETNRVLGSGVRFRPWQPLGEISLSGLFIRSKRPYFSLDENFQKTTLYHKVDFQVYEASWLLSMAGWELFLNQAYQVADMKNPWYVTTQYVQPDTIDQSTGQATYVSLSGLVGNLGISVEYKNYAYDLRPPSVYTSTFGEEPMRMPIISRPPIVYRESSATLSSRETHLINYNDELGYQIELNYYNFFGINAIFNYAQSSRHRFYQVQDGYYTIVDSRKMLPARDDAFKPYQQAHSQLERYFLDNSFYLQQTFSQFYAVKEYSSSRTLTRDQSVLHTLNIANITRAFTWLTKIDYTFSNGNSLALYHENQWLKWINDIDQIMDTVAVDTPPVISETKFTRPAYNRFVAFSFRYHKGITVSAIYDYASKTEKGEVFNTNPDDDNFLEAGLRDLGVNLRNKWFGIEITADVFRNNQITFFYGSEQGGLRCANGVCRQVAPFEDGFKLTIQSFY